MITIITGTPGAGKTLYTIQKLLAPLVGTHVPKDENGVTTLHPRTIYTNINGLQLEHELIGPGGTWTGKGGDWEYDGNPEGLRNWHNWVKPGAVIVFDEVQKVWPQRANGSAVPPDIQGLETHRHMGVDFILITQGPTLVDRNLHMLCGRHLHVRRVASMPFATVYEWDLMSRSLNFKAAMSKAPFRYSKKIQKLYISSSLHTKQKRALPGVLYFLPIAAALIAWKGPQAYDGIFGQHKIPVVSTHGGAADPKAPSKVPAGLPAVPGGPASPQSLPLAPVALAAASAPVFAGCMATATACRCYDTNGNSLEREPEACKVMTRPAHTVLAGGDVPDTAPPMIAPSPKYVPPQEPGHGLTELRRALREHYPNSHSRPVVF